MFISDIPDIRHDGHCLHLAGPGGRRRYRQRSGTVHDYHLKNSLIRFKWSLVWFPGVCQACINTECLNIYRKSVLHLRKYNADLY